MSSIFIHAFVAMETCKSRKISQCLINHIMLHTDERRIKLSYHNISRKGHTHPSSHYQINGIKQLHWLYKFTFVLFLMTVSVRCLRCHILLFLNHQSRHQATHTWHVNLVLADIHFNPSRGFCDIYGLTHSPYQHKYSNPMEHLWKKLLQ